MIALRTTAKKPVLGLSFGPDGLLVAGGGGGYDVWRLPDTHLAFIESYGVRSLHGCVCDLLGRWVYVSDYRGGLRLLPLPGGTAPPTPGWPHETSPRSFAVTADGRHFVRSRGGGGMNRLELWAVPPAGPLTPVWSLRDGIAIDPAETFLLHEAAWTTHAVAFGPGGRTVVTCESGASQGLPKVVVRDAADGRVTADLGATRCVLAAGLTASDDAAYVWEASQIDRKELATGRSLHVGLVPHRTSSFG